MLPNCVTITICGTSTEVRSALAELLGTTAPIAVAAAAPAPAAVVEQPKETAAQKKARLAAEAAPKTDAPAGQTVAPFAAAPATPAADTAPAAASPGPTATTAASPSEGEVSYDELKKLMTDVLSKKSAAFALDALQKATGHKALTGMPKEMYPKAKAALEAALT